MLDFPLPENEKALLQFIGLVNYFRDHVPHMTEMVQPLRKIIDMKKYKGSKKLTWTPESIEAFHFCRIAVSNWQELYFLEDTATAKLRPMHLIMVSEATCTVELVGQGERMLWHLLWRKAI